ncbi:MAG: nitroreductase family protein [Methanobacteriota archaeon]
MNAYRIQKVCLPVGAGTIAPDDIGYYLKKKRSVRRYTKDPIPRETILTILDTARYATSAGNGQPVEWIVIHDPKKVKKIAGLTIEWMKTLRNSDHPMSSNIPLLVDAWESGRDVICRGAPHLLVAHIPENNPMAQTDAIVAVTHFNVVSQAFGYGDIYARGILSLRNRQAATIAALAAKGTAPSQLRFHIGGGLRAGLSEVEIIEIMLLMSVFAGFPAALNGILATREVATALKAEGNTKG